MGVLPTSERQVRPLAKLEPSQQREVWQQAVAEAGGKVPSNRLVKSLVDQIKERTEMKYLKMLEDSQKTEQADTYKEHTRWEKSEKKSSLEKSGNPD